VCANMISVQFLKRIDIHNQLGFRGRHDGYGTP
jgi:hypothetical protein